MTGFRPPSVAGVSGGVGTTTLALALHGRDGGTGAGIDADIVVCRSSAESLDRAVRIADLFDPTAAPPVLAVSVDGAERRHPERLDELGPGWAAVVLVPHVGRWRGIVDPYREAAGLLGTPRDRLPRALRPYLDAVTRLARAVADSGRLGRPAPATRSLAPLPSGPTTFPRPDAPRPDAPVPLAVPPEPGRPPSEARFTAYRPFVPVGADGPLTSIAVPRTPSARPISPPPDDRPAHASDEGDLDTGTPAGRSAAGEQASPRRRGTDDLLALEATPAGARTAVHPDLRPVRGIRILDVASALGDGRPR
ncbi:hypothetical protein LWC35_31905 [Pseudonocardia kujensis]|uniref:hypothetical protein n=1 Tax=Pseudonocardia kujensis TaxID=1128675 RepID=UPI001E4EE39A|nr:hypothetical protein [Pseudonocardia kujensis]MCE0767467.1 hypothetical protein [Pseudonocardia kujensis]